MGCRDRGLALTRVPWLCRCAAIAATLVFVACRREEKPPVRTSPWPAPGISASGAATPARAAYRLSRGRASIEASVGKRRIRAALTDFDGTLEVNFEKPELTRGTLRADLRSLAVEGDQAAELTARLREQLGLAGGDDEHRFAELRLTAIDPGPRDGRGNDATVQADLTLHGFRMPVLLELSIDRGEPDAGSPGTLRVRTRRPLSIPLMAYGLLPESGPDATREQRRAFGREARISAEIEAEPTGIANSP
jgi:polyisoprenoid-binding protein YceI